MTLKRLMIILGILVVLAGVGIMWLWQYAYTPQGRARVIIAQLRGDSDTTLRGWMLKHHMIRPGFWEPLPQPGGTPYELRILAGTDEMVKAGREVLPVLFEVLEDDYDNYDVRIMAIRACGRFRDPSAIGPLTQCVDDAIPSPDMWGKGREAQSLSIDSLIEIGPASFGPLMQAFKSCRPSLPYDIPRMMADKWGAAAVLPLVRLLDDPDAKYRDIAATELVRLKDKRSAGALLRHLKDNLKSVRERAVDALGAMGDVPSLLTAMNDKGIEDERRFEAAGWLARMGRDEGLQFLLAMLKSTDALERTLAVDCLAATPKTIGPMLPLLGDSDETVRIRTMVALRESPDARVIPAVRKLLKDSDPEVREVAADVLKGQTAKLSPASRPGKP
jgi:HEAT repeat protein